jgi:ribosomal protein S18 acetylase RimI-like enzyme
MIQADPEQQVTVVTTYLHLTSREHFRPALIHEPHIQVMEAREPLPAFYRFLYQAVGQRYYWLDRQWWSDDDLYSYLSQSEVVLLVLYVHGTPAGYIELLHTSEEPGTEIVYFGLIPDFHGRGLGKHLLSVGVQQAFDAGAERVWLNTCTLDGPHALANYQARGFVPYRSATGKRMLPYLDEQ